MTAWLQGIGVSPGITIGTAYRYRPVQIQVAQTSITDTEGEWRRVLEALDAAAEQLQQLHQQASERVGAEQAAIFDAHRAFLHDPEIRQSIHQKIIRERLNAAGAVSQAFGLAEQLLRETDNPYLQERAADVRDVSNRLLRILQVVHEPASVPLYYPAIIVADDLTPSDTIQLDGRYVLALCMASGGPTSHVAILARSLGIPAVVSAGAKLLEVADGESIILDGSTGEVVLAADSMTLADFKVRQSRWEKTQAALKSDAHIPATTRDGHQVEVAANIGWLADIDSALQNGAEGVGLLRTEFLYMERTSLPDTETQAAIYRQIAQEMHPRPVVIRALDVGGDKPLPYLPLPAEANPFLGFRAIRMLLANRDMLRAQMHAVIQANQGFGNLRLMLPMISDISEIRAAREILDEVRGTQSIPIGMMVETPAAALLADQFAPLVDFFSIGSNDLTMYTLAVDRGSPHVSYLYDALHPAVLRLIHTVVEAAHKADRWVGICGELAGQREATAILVGLGVDELSMSPSAIPAVKNVIRGLDMAQARALATAALTQSDAASIHRLVSGT